jgi:insulysin
MTCSSLYSEIVEDSLAEFAYDAALAELSYSFAAVPTGLCIKVSGYNDKISVLLQSVLQRARTLLVNTERLEVIKEKVVIGLRSDSN